MMDHLGLSYREVYDIEILKQKNATSRVLFLPETSKIEATDIEKIWRSRSPIIITGPIPPELSEHLKFYTVGEKGKNPPNISGFLEVDGVDTVPFFYRYPLLQLCGTGLQKIGDIKDESGVSVGGVLGEKSHRVYAAIAPQLFRSATYLLAGGEATTAQENQSSSGLIDRFGRIDPRKTEIYRRGFLNIPIVNVYEKLLLKILLEFCNKRGKILVHKWFYPRSYDMAICLAHDVEGILRPDLGLDVLMRLKHGEITGAFAVGFLGLVAAISVIACKLHMRKSKNSLRLLPMSLARKLMRYNPLWNFDEYIDIEKQFGATSAFYFLNNSAPEDSDYNLKSPLIAQAIESLGRNGCEVGLHASFYSHLNAKKMREEKLLLEDISGKPVSGVTQHFVRICVPETWQCQESAGLTYDASFGYPQTTGFRAGTCLPFNPWNFKMKRTIPIFEIPLVIMDGALFLRAYMALSAEKSFQVCKKLAYIVYKHNGVLGLQWHLSVDREKDRLWFNLYPKILAYCSRFNTWYTNGEQMARWWNMRRSISLEKVLQSNSKLAFYIHSPREIKDFSLRTYIPAGYKDVKLFVNNSRLGKNNLVEKRNLLLFFFDLLRGRNLVELRFSRSTKKVRAEQNRLD